MHTEGDGKQVLELFMRPVEKALRELYGRHTLGWVSALAFHKCKDQRGNRLGPDIVPDIDHDIGGYHAPISGHPKLIPILIPISGKWFTISVMSSANRGAIMSHYFYFDILYPL